MDDSAHVTQPIALARTRGTHRFEVFSLKLKRRLTFDRRGAVDEWIVLESDPTVHAFCERPGYVQIGGHRFLADFQVCYADRHELLLLPDPVAVDNGKPHADLDASAVTLRLLEPAELAASRIWIDNWQRMLPCLIATRDLVSTSLLNAVERFVATAQSLLAIEREFSTEDPVVARGRIRAVARRSRQRP
ncbi:hypothetical protein [Burkholderia sp. PU8-34]